MATQTRAFRVRTSRAASQSPGVVFQGELRDLVGIFKKMESERQESGLVPMCQENEELVSTYIPYDPDLHKLNNKLTSLKLQAEKKLLNILSLAKASSSINRKLEQSLGQFHTQRLDFNERVGRQSSEMAAKRLRERSEDHRRRMNNLSLADGSSLLRSAKLHYLLNLPLQRPSKLIV